MSCLNDYNTGDKYDYIFNASNILIGDEGDNITTEILKTMNEKYSGKFE